MTPTTRKFTPTPLKAGGPVHAHPDIAQEAGPKPITQPEGSSFVSCTEDDGDHP